MHFPAELEHVQVPLLLVVPVYVTTHFVNAMLLEYVCNVFVYLKSLLGIHKIIKLGILFCLILNIRTLLRLLY
jgi:hypothetical protein